MVAKLLLKSSICFILLSCTVSKKIVKPVELLEIFPSKQVPVVIVSDISSGVEKGYYARLSERGECSVDEISKKRFSPTKEEILYAEKLALPGEVIIYPNNRERSLSKCARQYLGLSCGNKKYVIIHYLLEINKRNLNKKKHQSSYPYWQYGTIGQVCDNIIFIYTLIYMVDITNGKVICYYYM